MWDYNKLFAEGNVIGIKNEVTKEFGVYQITRNKELPRDAQYFQYGRYWDDFANTLLARLDIFIQYIIRLDEHGNVVERLFDRNRDMKSETKPMPELETGMFVRVKNSDWDENRLGFIYAENNHVIYQDGGYDIIDDDEFGPGIACYIVEVYSKDACAFEYCDDNFLIWRSLEYQAYLDSKSN